MKNIKKTITIIICTILIAILSILTYNVLASESLKIVDIEYSEDKWHSSILYSDNRLLMWDYDGNEKIVENVKKRQHTDYMGFEPDYLTYNNKLYYNSNTSGKIKKIENVVDFESGMISEKKVIAYKDTNNTLFYIQYDEYSEKETRIEDFKTYNFLELLNIYSIEHNITNYQENDNQVPVYLLFSRTCGYCKEFMNYLSTLNSSIYNKMKLIGIEIEDYYNEDLLQAVDEMYDFDSFATPTVLIGEANLVGMDQKNKQELLNQINTIYSKPANERYDFLKEYNSQFNIEPIELARNVKEFTINDYSYYGYIMYTTTNNETYVFGDNCFGGYLNDGYNFEEPYLLMQNVKKIDKYYLITQNNELYIFPRDYTSLFAIEDDVSKVIDYTKEYNGRYIVETSTGEQKILYYQNNDSYYVNYYGPTIKDAIFRDGIYYNTVYTLSTTGDLYSENIYYGYDFEVKKTNVKEIIQSNNSYDEDILVLYNNGELHYICYDENYCTADEFIQKMTGKTKFNKNDEVLILKDVETIKYYNDKFILMEDKSVYRYGSNTWNEFKGMDDISSSYIPVQIDELINNGKEIQMKEVIVSIDKNKIAIDDIVMYSVETLPANAEGKTSYYIEDTSIVKKENLHLTGVKEGQTKICGKYNNTNIIESCKTIDVYPKVNSINIVEDEITLKEYEEKIITLDYAPNDALIDTLNLDWKIDGKKYNNTLDLEFDEYYNPETNEYVELKPNQIAIEGSTGGTYTLELFQVGCDTEECKDTVIIHVEEQVWSIQLDIDEEYYDGYYNAYMFINEKDTLQVNYKISYETATNKKVYFSTDDTSIATIDQNGLITAHKPGRTIVRIESEDGGDTEEFYLTVYDYTKLGAMKGDVNQDGEVNILDVIKLRKYLAGLEDLEI